MCARVEELPRRCGRPSHRWRRSARERAGIRLRGYAIDDQENEPNIRCLAAPIHAADGRPIGRVSVSTVTFVVERDDLLALHQDIMDSATRLARLLA